MKFTAEEYIHFDPFEGDRDVDIRVRTVKLVKCRKPHACHDGGAPHKTPHNIQPGELARYEHALVEGEWGSYYMCLPCMEAWFAECGITPRMNEIIH